MSVDVTRGGLLVTLAVFGVIAYEFRTVLELFGVPVPLIPYLLGVVLLIGAILYFVVVTGGWRTDGAGGA